MAYGMLIDQKKCVGCQGCDVSCKAANGTPPGVFRSNVIRTNIGVYPDVERVITPMVCMQCAEPACVEACPVDATKKLDNGIITIDKTACIGCQSCIVACPYDARYYCDLSQGYFESGLTVYEEVAYTKMVDATVAKCDFCLSLAADGEDPQPACVAACVAEARIFGELDAIKSLASQEGAEPLKPEEGTVPSVFYRPNVRYL